MPDARRDRNGSAFAIVGCIESVYVRVVLSAIKAFGPTENTVIYECYPQKQQSCDFGIYSVAMFQKMIDYL